MSFSISSTSSTPTITTINTPTTITAAPRQSSLVIAGVVCALLPPPLHLWAVLAWLVVAFFLSPVRVWRWQFYLLIAVGLFSFAASILPFAHNASWTRTFTGVGLPLPHTLSVQPWVTLYASAQLCAGLLAAIWFFGQYFAEDFLKRTLRLVLILLCALSIIAAVGLAADFKNPAFPNTEVFSFFANRNQSATLYAIAALISGGLLFLERRRLWRGIALACVIASLTALALGPSRGGWLSVVAGLLVMLWGHKRGAAIGVGVAIVGAGIILMGLPGWEARPMTGAEVRPAFYADAWAMFCQNPLGIGAGNFQFIFPQYQSLSMGEKIVIHPENDWLWLMCELGFIGLLLPIALFTLPWGHHRRGRIIAAIVAAVAVVSFIDVPLHRLGLIILLCACMAPVLSTRGAPPAPRSTRWLFLLPLIFLGLGIFTYTALQKPREAFAASFELKNPELTRSLGAKLTRVLPYDHRTYQELAQAELLWNGNKNAADNFFKKSFALEPRLTPLPYEAGLLWQPMSTPKALAAWREALRRASADEKPVIFAKILRNGGLSAPEYVPLCTGNTTLWDMLLASARAEELGSLFTTAQSQKIKFWELANAPAHAVRALGSSRPPYTFFAKDPATPRRFLALIAATQGGYDKAVRLGLTSFTPAPLKDPYTHLSSDELALKAKLMTSQAPEYLEALAARAQKMRDEPTLLATLEKISRLPEASPAARAAYAQKLADRAKWLESWQQLRLILFPSTP